MKRKLHLDMRLLSINAMYYGNRNHGKTQEAREWSSMICHELAKPENKQVLADLRGYFKAGEHAYKISIKYFTPKMFTKSGEISAQSLDISNFEKPIIDMIFLPQNFGIGLHQCENLNIDDKHIVAMFSSKQFAPDFKVEISLSIISINGLDKLEIAKKTMKIHTKTLKRLSKND